MNVRDEILKKKQNSQGVCKTIVIENVLDEVIVFDSFVFSTGFVEFGDQQIQNHRWNSKAKAH